MTIGQKSTKKVFEFNIESNGRLKEPMKFEIKDVKYGGYKLCQNWDETLIRIGDIYLDKENRKYQSYCLQDDTRFDYHGIKNALYGKRGWKNPFTPKRILVIQMTE